MSDIELETGKRIVSRKQREGSILGDEFGFSLLEILVAVTIMGLAYVAILQSFSLSARNIVLMDKSRHELLTNSLAFEKQLVAMGQDEQGDMAESGEVLVDGGRYELVLVTDENNDFMTIMLAKK